MWKLILSLLAVVAAVADDSGESYFYRPVLFNTAPRSAFFKSFFPLPVLKAAPAFSTHQGSGSSSLPSEKRASSPNVDVTHVDHSAPAQQPFVQRHEIPASPQRPVYFAKYEYDHDDGRYEIDDDDFYVARPQVYSSGVGAPMSYKSPGNNVDFFKFKIADDDFRRSDFGGFGIHPVPTFYSSRGVYKYDFDDDDDIFDIDDDK